MKAFKKTRACVRKRLLHMLESRDTGVSWEGDYPSWELALQKCGEMGYAADNILQKTLESTLKVKNGEAVFERDSFLFDRVIYSFPVLACLFKVATECGNTLSVVDFGGALGSHYFQYRNILQPVVIRKWVVVEQEKHVDAGNRFVAEGPLSFAQKLEDVSDARLLLSSSTLQYVDKPYEYARRFAESGIEFILIDRLAVNAERRDRLTIETVPPQIYEARYPSWFLHEEKVLEVFKENYELMLDFESPIDKANVPSVYKGYLFKRKNTKSNG